MINHSDELKPTQKRRVTTLQKNQKSERVTEQAPEQVLNKQRTGRGTGTEQALVPYINSINHTNLINNTNIINLEEQKNISLKKNKSETLGETADAKKKLRPKKGLDDTQTIPPDWQKVVAFFNLKNASLVDAEKFFNHFQSNGWLVGGKSKMKDWQAAARNWLLNAVKFQPISNTPEPNHLHTSNTKNYGEPL
jgi:hypothetical protein